MAVITKNGYFGTPPIVTDGLVLNLDSFNTKSIPVDPTENLLKWSEQFDQSTWAKTSGSVSANTVTAPDGTSTADSFIETSDGVAGLHYMDNASFTQVPNNNYTFSLYISKASTRNIGISIGSSRLYASYNLATGTVGVVNSNGTDFVSHSAAITSIDSNWYRVSLSGYSLTTGGGYCRIILDATAGGTGGNGATYVGNGTSGSYIWGAQLDMSRYATPYIQSTATTGKRNIWYDLSGKNRNGTLLSGSTGTIPRYSKLNEGVLNFDGTGSVVNIGTSTRYLPLPQISLEAWFKSTGVGSAPGQVANGLLTLSYAPGITIGFGGRPYCQFTLSSNAASGYNINATAGPSLFDNKWHQVVATHNGTTASLYIDGVLNRASGSTWDGNVTSSWYPVRASVGDNPNNNNYVFSGSIALARVYSGSLTPPQVLQNYNAMKTRFNII